MTKHTGHTADEDRAHHDALIPAHSGLYGHFCFEFDGLFVCQDCPEWEVCTCFRKDETEPHRTWTTEKPTKPGWYWAIWADGQQHQKTAEIVYYPCIEDLVFVVSEVSNTRDFRFTHWSDRSLDSTKPDDVTQP